MYSLMFDSPAGRTYRPSLNTRQASTSYLLRKLQKKPKIHITYTAQVWPHDFLRYTEVGLHFSQRAAMLALQALYYLQQFRPSVRLSVTSRYCVKTTARSTMQFAMSYSKMCLVF